MTQTQTDCPNWCQLRQIGHGTESVRHYGRARVLHTDDDGGGLVVEVSAPLSGGRPVLIVTVTQDGRRSWHDLPIPRGAWLVDQLAGWWARRRRS